MKAFDFYYVLCFLCLSFYLKGQQIPSTQGELLNLLETSVRSGNKKSLRDLGSLLDKPFVGDKARNILRRYTMFTSDEINLEKDISKADFLNFYYDQEHLLQFSDITGNYYLSPLENRKIKSEITQVKILTPEKKLSQFHQAKEAIIAALDIGDGVALVKQINLLSQMSLPDAKQYTLDLSDILLKTSKKKWPPNIYQALNQALLTCSDTKSIESVLLLLQDNHIEKEAAIYSLSMISNIEISETNSKKIIIQQYKHYIDSLGTIENIRAYGYEKVFSFQPSFFDNMADYYGRVLCFANDRHWLIHNAIIDLVRTTHPRALFYLTAIGFKNQSHYPDAPFKLAEAIQLISQSTHIGIGVEDEYGNILFPGTETTTRYAQLNYLTYWSINYDDYEWDASRDMFVNKHQALEKTQHYERLFRRLNSRNDSVAMASFQQLTEGDPSEIVALANKYRQMFRSYNQTLPPFKYKYLEQLSQLTLFCRYHNITYQPGKKLHSLLEQLNRAEEQPARYEIENNIIKTLSIKDITPVEYWACLHQENEDNNFSIGRILDIFYSNHWREIMTDDLQLRLYLKKADLLKNIGVIGVCNGYLNKFDLDKPGTIERLQQIKTEETDQEIINQIAQLVQFNESEDINAVSDFIATPLFFDKRDIKILPPPTEEEIKQITRIILSEEDNNVMKQLFFYLRLHPKLKNVPYLFEVAKDDRVMVKRRGKVVTVGDNVTPILESIFNYNFVSTAEDKIFDIRPWIKIWEKDKDNYKRWPKQFFEKKMKFLDEQKELSIEDINLITESPNYDSTYKHFCLNALKKVKPVKSIRSLSIEPKLSVKTDLNYFETFKFKYKELDDLPKLFELDAPETMLNFLVKRAEQFDMEEKGSFYNNMFRHGWFSTYINSGKVDLVTVAYIQQLLETYLNDSDYLSEYEEQITTLHIAQLQNIGKPLEERLLAPFDLIADVTAKAKIQETIISTISYSEISIIARHFTDLTATLGPEPWAFLHRDFGIPVFDLSDKEAYQTFRRNFNDKTEYELYFHYLKEFGIDFLTKKGELDFEKIANILRFDSVTPFVGGGGGKRDFYTYGIIKLLELNFSTRLGFHEKLNENQSFYTFSTANRSQAWIDFLTSKGLIQVPVDQAPSFNRLLK